MRRLILGCILVLALGVMACAVPDTITYQGRLLQNGEPVSGNKLMDFRIYNDASAGTLIWSTTNVQILVQEGIYSVALQPLNTSDFDHEQVYLEVSIDGSPFLPRTRFTSVSYAFLSNQAELANLASTANVALAMNASGLQGSISVSPVAPANSLAVSANGNVLIGGDLEITTSGNGIVFYDGSKQMTAAQNLVGSGQGPTGNPGPQGPTGNTGPKGPTGNNFFSQNGSKIYYNGGNVGIGVSNPQKQLEVANNVMAWTFNTGPEDYMTRGAGRGLELSTGQQMRFKINNNDIPPDWFEWITGKKNTELMRLTEPGNLARVSQNMSENQ